MTLCFVLADVLWQEWLAFGLFLRRPRLLTLPPIGTLSMTLVGAVACVTVYTFHYVRAQMTTILSVRIDSDTKDQLEALAKRARRSKSFLAAEAIAAYVEAEKWQLDEIQAGLQDRKSTRLNSSH